MLGKIALIGSALASLGCFIAAADDLPSAVANVGGFTLAGIVLWWLGKTHIPNSAAREKDAREAYLASLEAERKARDRAHGQTVEVLGRTADAMRQLATAIERQHHDANRSSPAETNSAA